MEVEFQWFSPISLNGHATAAQALVWTALTNWFLQFWVLPIYPPPQFRNNSMLVLPNADLPEFPKVWSNLKLEIPAGHRKQFLVKESDLRVVSHQGAHCGHLRERTLQAENLRKLLNAGSGREWWNLIHTGQIPNRDLLACQLRS